ncbi:MAG: KEOPS complex subunit Pcc1 [Nanoarchaeota archaeon]|nr:KEOPS complex subunit Pcc1 [Nanoarchaeota archaeon]
MKYEAVVKVVGSVDLVYKAFIVEKGKFSRSEFDVVQEGDEVHFVVKAQDPAALRATLNSITKLLSVYEKAKGE